MSQTSRLVIELDTRSAEQKSADLRRALEGLNSVGLRSGPVFTGAGSAISTAGDNAKSASGQMSALERQIKSLTAAASGLAGPLVAAVSVKQLYDAVEAYSTLTNRLKLVTNGSAELAAAQKAIFSTAQEARQPLSATAELYQRIATNQKELGLTGEGVAGVVRTISKTLAISGTSAASADAALVQLGQAFASGTLRGEELNSVLEQAPALSQAIAAGMGKTVGELRSLGAEGVLTADAVVKALKAQAKAVDEQFAKMAPTIGNSLTVVGNSFTNFVGQLDEAVAGSSAFAKQILSVSEVIDGSLPGAISTVKENASDLEQVLSTGLYLALGRVAGGYAQQAASALYAANASRQALNESAKTAQMSAMVAQAKQLEAKEGLALANMQIRAAEGQVASERALAAAELEGLRATQAALASERALEQQRLQAQINAKGRTASLSRLAEISQASIAINGQVEAAEKRLAATTVATSTTIERAYAARTAAATAYAETTAAANAAVVASERAASAASVTSRALGTLRTAGTGLLGIMGGPLGLAVTAGAVALSFADFRSESERLKGDMTGLGKSIEAVRDEFNKLNRDQQQAKVNEWRDKQLGAAMAVEESYKDLKDSIRAAMIDTSNADFIDLGKIAEQTRAADAVIAKLDEAKASGKALSPIMREAAASGQITPAQLKSWESQASLVSDNVDVLTYANQVLSTQTSLMDTNTAATNANNAAKAGFTKAGETYLGTLQKQLGKLQDNNDAVKEANRYIAEHAELSEADRIAILSAATAVEAQEKANKAATKSAQDLGKAYQENAGQKMLDDARQRYAVLMQQKSAIDDQGKGARTLGVEAKKLIELETEIAQLKEKKTLTAAQKQVLAMADLNLAQQKQNAALEQANKLDQQRLENAAKLLSFQDQLNDSLETEQQGLDAQIAGLGSGKKLQERIREDLKIRQDYQRQLAKLQRDYQRIVNPTAEQTDLYEKETRALKSALDKRLSMQEDYYQRLDAAQSDWAIGANDAWHDYIDSARDIAGQTYDVFSNAFQGMEDALVDFVMTGKLSFKDLANSIIADIARILIRTKVVTPILNSLFGGSGGGGGLASAVAGGGSGGGFNLESAWNTVSGAYSVATSGFGQAWSAGWNSGEGFMGGLAGAIKSGSGYITTSISSLFTSTSGQMVNGVYQLGSSGSVATVDLISNTVTNSTTGAVTGTATGATSAASAGLSASSAVMYGIGGAIQGYLKAGVKGAVAGAGGAVAGAYAGAAIGSAIPVIGNAIGGAIGAVLGGMFGSSLFGGDWVTKDQGFQLGVTDGQLKSYFFKYQKKKGGLFSSNKKRTRLSALDPEMQKALDGTYAATLGTVIGLFDSLNVTLNDGVLDGLNVAATKISTKNKTAEQIQEEIGKWFTGLGDAAVGTVAKATGETSLEGYTLNQLTTSVNALLQLNAILEKTNNGMLDVTVGGLHLAERLAELGGGMEKFAELTAGYYEKFVPEAERADDVLIDVGRQFSSLNIAFPSTRDGFRKLVEAMDVTTEAGQGGYVALMNLAAGADAAYTILEARAKALIDGVSVQQSAVQRAVEAEKKAAQEAYNSRVSSINDMLATAQEAASTSKSINSALENALKALRGTSDESVQMMRGQAKATVQSALAIAKAGGSLANFTGLEDALSVISSNDTSLYASLEDFNREQGRNANLVAELNALNGKQLSSSEQTVKTLQDQLKQAQEAYEAQTAGLDAQLEWAQQQIDALNGVDNSVKSVADAVKEMNAAVVAAIATISGKSTPQNAGVLIDTIYKDVLGRPADAGGKQYWQDQLSSGSLNNQNIAEAIKNAAAVELAYKAAGIAMNEGAAYWNAQLASGALTPDQLQEAVRNAAKANGSIPAFATGGMHSGGIRLVGERGPELEVTGPARIYNASQTAAMLKGGDGWKEVVAAIQVLQQYAYQTTKNTGNTAQELRQQNEAGVLIQGATA